MFPSSALQPLHFRQKLVSKLSHNISFQEFQRKHTFLFMCKHKDSGQYFFSTLCVKLCYTESLLNPRDHRNSFRFDPYPVTANSSNALHGIKNIKMMNLRSFPWHPPTLRPSRHLLLHSTPGMQRLKLCVG